MKSHMAPWECTYAKEDKSRCRPGARPRKDHEYFEILCLCILQAGLNWGTVRRNWQKYRRGFLNFSINKLANKNPGTLMRSPDVIRNRKKIEGIVHNAEEFRIIRKEYGSFRSFLKSLRRKKTNESIKLLKTRFWHVGDYTAEFYLHCVGHR